MEEEKDVNQMEIWASPLAEAITWERAGKGAELVALELHSSQIAAIGDSETLFSFVQSKSGLKHSRDNSVYPHPSAQVHFLLLNVHSSFTFGTFICVYLTHSSVTGLKKKT